MAPSTRASQGSSQPSKSARKKRQRSPASSAQEPVNKRVQRASAQPEVVEHVIEETESTIQVAVEPEVVVDASEIQDLRSRRVRFSESGDGALTPPATQEASQSTPTRRKRGRKSSSPGATPHPNITKTHTTRRSSLTTTTHSSPIGVVEEYKYVPLRQVLDERQRRRLRRSHMSEEVNEIEEHQREDRRTRHELEQAKQKIEDLEFELESRRQLGIDISVDDDSEDSQQVKKMKDEIARLKQEVEEKQSQSQDISYPALRSDDLDMDESDDDDVNRVSLIIPEDIGLAPSSPVSEPHFDGHSTMRGTSFTMTQSGRISEGGTQVSLPDPTHEVEITRFEQEITHLERAVADKQAALKLLTIELQALGFSSTDESAEVILPSIRGAFKELRAAIEQLLPQLNINSYSNGKLFPIIAEAIEGLLDKIAAQEIIIAQEIQKRKTLEKQHNGILDTLSVLDEEHKELRKRFHALDKLSDEKEKKILEYEALLETAEDNLDNRDEVIVDREAIIAKLERDNADQATTINRLQTALTGYRDEINTLEATIMRLEAAHKAEKERLIQEHEAAMNDLQSQLDTETSNRKIAEDGVDAKTTYITQLERKIEEIETELDNLNANLADTQTKLEVETTTRVEVESDLTDHRAEVESLTNRINGLESGLEALREELANLRNNRDAERRQREAAEGEVDNLNSQLADTTKKYHEEGKRAQELRNKLFELQQQREQQIKQLEVEAEEREDQFQNDMDAEVQRREAVEQNLRTRDLQIANLKDRIAETEETMDALLEQKNEDISNKDQKIANLEEELETSRQELANFTAAKTVEIEGLHANIAALNKELDAANDEIRMITEEARLTSIESKAQLEAHEAEITTLEDSYSAAQAKIEDLEAQKASLEFRVEEEATAMLDLTNQTADKEKRLKAIIQGREDEIADLRQSLANTQEQAHADVTTRDNEIEGLRVLADNRALEIVALSRQVVDLKGKFKKEVEANRASRNAMLAPIREALGQAEAEDTAREAASYRELDVVENMSIDGVVVSTTGVRMNEKVKVVKTGKKNKKRTFADSGIGLGEEPEVEMEQV